MWAFEVKNVFEKISLVKKSADFAINNKIKQVVPTLPFRDVPVLDFKSHPEKKGFSSKEGQARMLHDLASIELQAMELGLRTLAEFPDVPQEFKEELWQITLSESTHLEMCLIEIESLGFKWGDWPVNCGLWSAVSENDSIIDRVLIVHRYLEGSGLDAGDTLIRRLAGVKANAVQRAVQIINDDEVGHVKFGSRWYIEFCKAQNLDPGVDFFERMKRLRFILPKRINPLNHELRIKAGFTQDEINYLENLRLSFLEKESIFKKVKN
jgi:uncharacterized ferritin-like protein (DUF455 family)